MLIFRYLLRETFKSQLAVFLVLMAIFVTQKFVRVLEGASNGDIPAALVLGFLGLKMPVLASMILPLSLFLGIMLAHGRLHVESEMTVMHACGISEWYVTRVMLVLGVMIGLVSASLTLYFAPLAIETEYQLEEQAGAESGLTTLIPGRFQETGNRRAVMFVHDVGTRGNELDRVFLAQHENTPGNKGVHLVYAQRGRVEEDADGAQKLILSNGNQYEGERGAANYQVIDFEEYQIQISEQQGQQQRRKLNAYPTNVLWDDPGLDAIAELQWRLAIPLSLPFLVLIAVPMSTVNPRQGRFGKIFPALLLYLGYFMLLMAGRKLLEDGKSPAFLGLWWVHAVMLLIGTVLVAKGRTVGIKVKARLRGATP